MRLDRRSFCLALPATCILTTHSFGLQTDIFQARIFRNQAGESIPYRLFVPETVNKTEKYPLVLWLHGGAGRGSDNLKQISGGNTLGSHVWTSADRQAKQPSFVVAPQCPEDNSWTTEQDQPTRPLKLAIELVKEIQHSFPIDAERTYVTGQSMGGFGSWSVITADPNMFAAAVPICGGGDEAAAGKLTHISIWAFHGAQDQSVSVTRSRKMIEALKRAGGTPRYTEYKNAGHDVWTRAFAEPELLPWVFGSRRKS
jgi:predicted peptidase